MMENFQQLVRDLLSGELPGKAAQRRMIARPKIPVPETVFNSRRTPAATLILLYPTEDQIRFILTRRSQTVDQHKGQISLPGGVQNEGEDLKATALRETWEEIGVPPDHITILGQLSPLQVKVSGYNIHPFVGWMDFEPMITPSPEEVEDVFSVPLAQLLDDITVRHEDMKINRFPLAVPFFQFESAKVWGATAMILSEFKVLIQKHYAPNWD
ncbi:MAG: NUDIX hydrolase [Fidelibacterota bacterium]